MKYEAEILYLKVIYDVPFNYGIEILINWQN